MLLDGQAGTFQSGPGSDLSQVQVRAGRDRDRLELGQDKVKNDQ